MKNESAVAVLATDRLTVADDKSEVPAFVLTDRV